MLLADVIEGSCYPIAIHANSSLTVVVGDRYRVCEPPDPDRTVRNMILVAVLSKLTPGLRAEA